MVLLTTFLTATPFAARAEGQACFEIFSYTEQLNPSTQTTTYNNSFRVWRSLQSYLNKFGDSFKKLLMNPPAGGIWLDAGAGMGLALTDYLTLPNFGPGYFRTIGASLRYPDLSLVPMAPEVLERFRQIFKGLVDIGRLEYNEGDILSLGDRMDLYGKVDLITDVVGPAAYTNLPHVLTTYMRLLKTGGKAYIFVRALDIVEPGDYGGEHKKPLDNMDYFAQASGFRLQRADTPEGQVFVFTRTEAPIFFPQLLARGIHLGTDDHVVYEWIRSAADWAYSWYNPQYVNNKGWRIPPDFVVPQ